MTHATGREAPEWVPVATLGELRRRKKKLVSAEGQDIALFLRGDDIYALQDVCIHKGRQLSRGTVLRDRVVCPGHQWQFDLETGWVEAQGRCQPTHAVKVEGDTIYVDPERRTQYEPTHQDDEG